MLYIPVNVMHLFQTSTNVPVILVNMTDHVGIVSMVMYATVNLGIQGYTVKQVHILLYKYLMNINLI